tara:strand:+ start:378 stop:593 length:216 start_codon:yes stop_codon:yes gene_type:complete
MNKFKPNHKILIRIENLSDENNWADNERFILDMSHLDGNDENIKSKYKVIYKKAKMLRKIIDFLEIKYSEL